MSYYSSFNLSSSASLNKKNILDYSSEHLPNILRILVLGATGYIGNAVALSLLRNNHKVYGLAREPATANRLARHEIIPVLASAEDSDAYIQLIKTAHIDVVVDCVGSKQTSAKVLSDVKEAGKERLKEGGAKLGFVYTSGTWMHGSSKERGSDLDPVGTEYAKAQPPRLVAWRSQVEKDVLSARDILDTVVVRPALVYGRKHVVWHSFLMPLLAAASRGIEEDIEIRLEPTSRPGLIHVDDVAEGFRCAIEKLPLISGTSVYPVFDLMTSQESLRDILSSFGEAVGLKGRVKLVSPSEDDVFAEAFQTSRNGDSSRAEQLLGWVPKRRGFVAGMDMYATAFSAAAEDFRR